MVAARPEPEFRCKVRAPQPRDYRRMAELAGELGYDSTPRQVARRVRAMVRGESTVLVAEARGGRLAGQILGWIGLSMFRAVELDAFVEISGLVVGTDVRSHGVGRQLLAAAEAWARRRGCRAIGVHTNQVRERARAFYEANRFEYVKTHIAYLKRLKS